MVISSIERLEHVVNPKHREVPPHNRQTKVQAMREAQRRQQRHRQTVLAVVTLVVVLGGVVATVVGLQHTKTPAASGAAPIATKGSGLPPWPAPTAPAEYIKAAGLYVSAMEGASLHFHDQLSSFVDGQRVQVPANLGIDPQNEQLAELHTHDNNGELHIEGHRTDTKFTLGQLFTEWDVRLDPTHLGGLRVGDGKNLRLYVNAKPVSGNPADLELSKHQVIVVVYGSDADQPSAIPSTYDWKNL